MNKIEKLNNKINANTNFYRRSNFADKTMRRIFAKEDKSVFIRFSRKLV